MLGETSEGEDPLEHVRRVGKRHGRCIVEHHIFRYTSDEHAYILIRGYGRHILHSYW